YERVQPAGGFGLDQPAPARVCDYLLGGAHNVSADRRLAKQVIAAVPDSSEIARAHRAFVGRAVRTLIQAGQRQFLDSGCGAPTHGSPGQTIPRVAAGARIVCVDSDPIIAALARNLLAGNQQTVAIQADLHQPVTILNHPDLAKLLNLDQPIGVILTEVLPLVADTADPAGILAQLCDRLPPGSHLVISHSTSDIRPDDTAATTALYHHAGIVITPRPTTQVRHLFTDLDVVPPGIVPATHWRPDPDPSRPEPTRMPILASVARIPGNHT